MEIKSMKAKEAAERVKLHENCTEKEILDMIPKYSNNLPRRAWLKTFRSNLPAELREKFISLK